MRKLLPSILLVISALVFSVAAHADTLDQFELTGPGLDVTYSLNSTFTTPDFSLFNFFSETATATINGVSGYSITGDYYAAFFPYVSAVFSFPANTVTPSILSLSGPHVYSFVTVPDPSNPPPYLPYDVVATFNPGVYNLDYSLNGVPVAYTLTITPETATTPEPSSLILLATGAFASLGVLRRRRISS